jgi:phosphopantetheinyl transferase
VTLAHTGESAVAIASRDAAIGVDLEAVGAVGEQVAAASFDAGERSAIAGFHGEHDERLARAWCAKEAAGKALGTGLPSGPRDVVLLRASGDAATVVRAGADAASAFDVITGTLAARAFAVCRLQGGERS